MDEEGLTNTIFLRQCKKWKEKQTWGQVGTYIYIYIYIHTT